MTLCSPKSSTLEALLVSEMSCLEFLAVWMIILRHAGKFPSRQINYSILSTNSMSEKRGLSYYSSIFPMGKIQIHSRLINYKTLLTKGSWYLGYNQHIYSCISSNRVFVVINMSRNIKIWDTSEYTLFSITLHAIFIVKRYEMKFPIQLTR